MEPLRGWDTVQAASLEVAQRKPLSSQTSTFRGKKKSLREKRATRSICTDLF